MRGLALLGLATAGISLAFQPDVTTLRHLFETHLARSQQEFGSADPRTSQAARDLSSFLSSLNDRGAARKAWAETIRIDEQALGASAPQTLEDVAALAAISPPAEAEPLLRRAVESPDPTVAGPALTSLAELRKAVGDRASAAVLLRRAVEKAEAIDGKEGPTVALVLNALVQVVEPKEAIELLKRALAIDETALGAKHPRTLSDARRLAGALRQAGRTAEAAGVEQKFKLSAAR